MQPRRHIRKIASKLFQTKSGKTKKEGGMQFSECKAKVKPIKAFVYLQPQHFLHLFGRKMSMQTSFPGYLYL